MPGRPAECCTTAVPVKARTRERMPRLRCSGRRRSPRARRRATRIAVCVVGLLLWGSVATAQEREAAGRIKIAAGSVFIVRANNTMPAKAGQDVYIALDVASSELWASGGRYVFKKSGEPERTSAQMVELYEDWIRQYPIISIEDGVAEGDWEGWKLLTKAIGGRVQLVGDDVFVTNPAILERGIADHVARK